MGSSSSLGVNLQHLAALVPPPEHLLPLCRAMGRGLVPEEVGVLPQQEPCHGLDAPWGPMLLALHRLGTAGLQCCMGLGCRQGLCALVRGLSHWSRAGREGVPWGQMGMGRETHTARVQGIASPAKGQVAARIGAGLRVTGQRGAGQCRGDPGTGTSLRLLPLHPAKICQTWCTPSPAKAAAVREFLPALTTLPGAGQELSPTFQGVQSCAAPCQPRAGCCGTPGAWGAAGGCWGSGR